MGAFFDYPHRRYNPLADEWVLVSPQRTQRPWHGQIETPAVDPVPAYDPTCYLCPGNTRASGARNPHYTTTYVFENDFAALLPATPPNELRESAFFQAQSVRGICRVICFAPQHNVTLADLEPAALRAVVDTWVAQMAELSSHPELNYVQIFENHGAMMGASNPHPHGQIWGTAHIPQLVAREQATQAAYYAQHGRTLLADYLEQELERTQRLVCANASFVALVPFWAVWPFETLVISRRPHTTLLDLAEDERTDLATLLQQLIRGYNALFQTSFPYSMGFHQQPCDGEAHPEWHLHAHFYPPLLRSATVRKFMVGFELLGEPQRDLTPEQAAARLREALGSGLSYAQ